jgi:hypothetical protein
VTPAGALPRQQLKELFKEIRLTGQKHIIVEGRADAHFIRAWIQNSHGRTDVVVTPVEYLEVSDSVIFTLNLLDSNRSRVIVVALEAAEKRVNLRCVAHRDCGHGVAEHQYETLLWTDYPAMESYAVDEQNLNTANLLNFGAQLPDANELLAPISFALRELYAVRCHHQDLERPKYEAGLGTRSLAEFDVTATVHVSIRPHVEGYSRPDFVDPRGYGYGHDIGELLLEAFGNALKNRSGLRTLAAVEAALRSAIQVTGRYESEPLFVQLQEWIAS